MKTFDITECADFLKVDASTIQKLAKEGQIPGAKIGRAWVFLEEDVVAYLRQKIKDQLTARLNGDAFRDADLVLQAAIDRQMAIDGSASFAESGPHGSTRRGRPKRPLPRLPDFAPPSST